DSLVINGNSYLLAKNIRRIAKWARQGVPFIALARSLNAAGTTYSASPIPNYNGTFEGLGNKISNLTINSSQNGAALFGTLGNNLQPGTIRDLEVESANVTYTGFGSEVAILVDSENDGIIENCYATGQVTSTFVNSNVNVVGGLVAAVGLMGSVINS